MILSRLSHGAEIAELAGRRVIDLNRVKGLLAAAEDLATLDVTPDSYNMPDQRAPGRIGQANRDEPAAGLNHFADI